MNNKAEIIELYTTLCKQGHITVDEILGDDHATAELDSNAKAVLRPLIMGNEKFSLYCQIENVLKANGGSILKSVMLNNSYADNLDALAFIDVLLIEFNESLIEFLHEEILSRREIYECLEWSFNFDENLREYNDDCDPVESMDAYER